MFDDALAAGLRATILAPDLALAPNNIGSIQLELGDFGDAIESFQRTLDLAPKVSEAHVNLGL